MTVSGRIICFDVEMLTISQADLGCDQIGNTTFEYYIFAKQIKQGKFEPVGNTVIVEDSCYIDNKSCEIEYCLDTEIVNLEEDVFLQINQTRFRRNNGVSGLADMWPLALNLNGNELSPTIECQAQINTVNKSGCSCSALQLNLAIPTEGNTPNFNITSIVLEETDNDSSSSFIDSNILIVGVALGAFVFFVLVVFIAVKKYTLRNSEAVSDFETSYLGTVNASNFSNNYRNRQQGGAENPKYKNSSFVGHIEQDLDLTIERSKAKRKGVYVKQEKSLTLPREEEVEEIEAFKETIKENCGFKSLELRSSVTFKTEQRLIRLQPVFIERLLFLVIDCLNVTGPDSTLKATVFKPTTGTREDFRAFPLGKFLQGLKEAVNDFGEEDDTKGNSLGNKVLLIALIYLKRAQKRNTTLLMNDTNIRNMLFISVVVATKFLEDFAIPNSYWAEYTSVDVSRIGTMELSFCNFIDYDLYVSTRAIKHLVNKLEMSSSSKF